jgi:hypothetical protein
MPFTIVSPAKWAWILAALGLLGLWATLAPASLLVLVGLLSGFAPFFGIVQNGIEDGARRSG